MSKEEFKNRIYEIFEEAGIAVRDNNQLEAESLQYIEFVTAVEDEFDIDLPDEFLAFSAVKNIELFIDSIFEYVNK